MVDKVLHLNGDAINFLFKENQHMFQRHPIQSEALMFITTNTMNRRKVFANPAYAREVIETLYRVQELHPFFLFGFVIMPDHCHLLLNVPPPESISRIMNCFKSGVSHNIGLGTIWQTRFHMRIVQNSRKVLKYIHLNPVRARIAEIPENYPWSSACGRWDVTPLDIW